MVIVNIQTQQMLASSISMGISTTEVNGSAALGRYDDADWDEFEDE